MRITNVARAVAARCEDAYSFSRYRNWPAVAQVLLDRGLTEKEAEAIMRSKWVRWAGDASDNRYGQYTAGDVTRWLADPRNMITPLKIRQLVVSTFGDAQ